MKVSKTVLPSTIERLQGEISRSDENSLIGLWRVAHPGGSFRTSQEVRQEIAQYTSSPHRALFIARLAFGGYMGDQETAGFAATQIDTEHRTAAIDHLIVSHAARGHKIGRVLVETAIKFAEAHHADSISYAPLHLHGEVEAHLLSQLDFIPNTEQTPVRFLTDRQ